MQLLSAVTREAALESCHSAQSAAEHRKPQSMIGRAGQIIESMGSRSFAG
jgi:hypothetical protein